MKSMNTKTYSAKVSSAVATEMEKRGISINEASKQSGVPYVTLYRRLTHPESNPFNVDELARVAEALGAPISEFLKETT